MAEGFVFHGQTTFINQPQDTVIKNFQNNYITGDGSSKDKINTEIKTLVELVLSSKELPQGEKEEAVQALHSIAEQVKGQKGSKLAFKSTLQAIQEMVSKATDIAVPALKIITTVLKMFGFS